MPKQTAAQAFLAELISIPGLSGVAITRADNRRAMIDVGHDAATADLFSFSRNARVIQGPAHPKAYEIAVAVGRDDRAAMAALLDA